MHKQCGASLRRLNYHFDNASAPDVVLVADVYALAHLHLGWVKLSALVPVRLTEQLALLFGGELVYQIV